MESGQNVNAYRMEGYLIEPLNEGSATSQHDIMTRRLKNRERQRRYRARKRLEADRKKACIINQSIPLQVEMQVNDIPHNCVTRIHCPRDWKKDARRACVSRNQEIISNGPVIPDPISICGSQVTSLPSGVEADIPLTTESHYNGSAIVDHSETHRIMPSRRRWKAEARNKKS